MSRLLGLGLLLASLALAAPLSEKALTEADKLLSQPAPRLLYFDPKEPIEAYEKRHDEPLSAAWKRLSDRGFDVQLDKEAFRKAGSTKLVGPECGIWWNACDQGSLHRMLRRAAWHLHPSGVVGVVDGKVVLTTRAALAARGGKEVPHAPRLLKAKDAIKRSEDILDRAVDVDFSDVDPKDVKLGSILALFARRYKFPLELRAEVFALYGVSEPQDQPIRLPAGKVRIGLRALFENTARQLKVGSDEVVVMVGEDGAVVITTKKYRDDPIPPEAVKAAE